MYSNTDQIRLFSLTLFVVDIILKYNYIWVSNHNCNFQDVKRKQKKKRGLRMLSTFYLAICKGKIFSNNHANMYLVLIVYLVLRYTCVTRG